MQGITNGFRITTRPYRGPPVMQRNYKSATCVDNRQAVEAQIKEEINNRRYACCEKPPTLVSALGAIPKHGTNKVRLIHDCSRPIGGALNDYAESDHFAYQSLKDAAALIQPGDYLAKVDLSNAYRSVKIHPDDHHLTGLQWTFEGDSEPTFMQDHRLPFGAQKSPEIFNSLTQAVRSILLAEGEQQIIAYLDDFLCVGRTKADCLRTTNRLLSVLRQLGFSINYNKVVGPTKQLVFLGVSIDTDAFTLSLPKSKLQDLREELEATLVKHVISKRGLQSLVGKLNWASTVIYGGRTHLRQIIDRIIILKAPHHKTRVSAGIKDDLEWWIRNVALFNGYTPISESREATHVCIDACNAGGGGVYQGAWYHLPWQDWPGTEVKHINYKEVLALVPAVSLWAPDWSGKTVFVYSDNQAAVGILNRGTAKDPYVMGALRWVWHQSVVHNFRIRAIYYPGCLNIAADAASRLSERGGWDRLHRALHSMFLW